jgi:hypothetical protein
MVHPYPTVSANMLIDLAALMVVVATQSVCKQHINHWVRGRAWASASSSILISAVRSYV